MKLKSNENKIRFLEKTSEENFNQGKEEKELNVNHRSGIFKLIRNKNDNF